MIPQEEIKLLISSTRGRFFIVEFIGRQSGSLRRLVGRVGVKKGLVGEGMGYDPRLRGLQTLWTPKGWKSFSLSEVSYFKCGTNEAGSP